MALRSLWILVLMMAPAAAEGPYIIGSHDDPNRVDATEATMLDVIRIREHQYADRFAVERVVASADGREIAAVTREAMAELPEIFRTALILRELEGMAYQEMAELLGISIGTVESRLFRARARFREALIRLYPEYAGGD